MRYKQKVQSRKFKVETERRYCKVGLKSSGVATLLILTFSLSIASAQESINATGSIASGIGGSASYSVGQIACQTNTGTNGSVAQGVQQPYEILVVAAIEETKSITLSLTASPNPVNDYLQLKIDAPTMFESHSMLFQLYDINGKLIQSNIIASGVTQSAIDMQNLKPATYFLKVIRENKEVKTFKIIKN